MFSSRNFTKINNNMQLLVTPLGPREGGRNNGWHLWCCQPSTRSVWAPSSRGSLHVACARVVRLLDGIPYIVFVSCPSVTRWPPPRSPLKFVHFLLSSPQRGCCVPRVFLFSTPPRSRCKEPLYFCRNTPSLPLYCSMTSMQDYCWYTFTTRFVRWAPS